MVVKLNRREAMQVAAGLLIAPQLIQPGRAVAEQVPQAGRVYDPALATRLFHEECEGRGAVVTRWSDSGLLPPPEIPGMWDRHDLAILLENQRLSDSLQPGYPDVRGTILGTHLDLVKRVYAREAPFRVLAQHWTVLGPKGFVFWGDDDFAMAGHDECEVRTDALKVVWSAQHDLCLGGFGGDELMDVVAQEVELELVNGLVGFLQQHAVVVHGARPRQLAAGVQLVRQQVARETGRKPDVMHIDRDMACLLGVKIPRDGLFPFVTLGTWEDMRVVVNAMAPSALLAFRGNQHFSGDAALVSYLPFIPTPLVRDVGEDKAWRHGYTRRHAGVTLRGDRRPAVGIVNMRS